MLWSKVGRVAWRSQKLIAISPSFQKRLSYDYLPNQRSRIYLFLLHTFPFAEVDRLDHSSRSWWSCVANSRCLAKKRLIASLIGSKITEVLAVAISFEAETILRVGADLIS